MEVHHHPDIHHQSKPWKEYLLEGLMIFVAVTLGFFAESLRENLSDKEKEKEYVISLVKNLEEDTSNLKNTIADNRWKIKGLDSLVSLSVKDVSDPGTRRLLYNYSGRYVSFYSAFGSNDATMMQLKNAGGLRFIRRDHVADSIAKYDQEMGSIYKAEGPYSKAINDAMESMEELLVYSIYNDSVYYQHGTFTSKELPLLTDNKEKIIIFFNKIAHVRGWTKNYLTNMEERLPYAIRLIAFLKKEYGLD